MLGIGADLNHEVAISQLFGAFVKHNAILIQVFCLPDDGPML
jgi:hypothetical protein